jgi:hypothetical protein
MAALVPITPAACSALLESLRITSYKIHLFTFIHTSVMRLGLCLPHSCSLLPRSAWQHTCEGQMPHKHLRTWAVGAVNPGSLQKLEQSARIHSLLPISAKQEEHGSGQERAPEVNP